MNILEESSFEDDLDDIIFKHREKANMTYAEIIGLLEIRKQMLFVEMVEENLNEGTIESDTTEP